ncbi:MAG: hypothetical protein V1936_02145 [Patescibacteria group bacterium]
MRTSFLKVFVLVAIAGGLLVYGFYRGWFTELMNFVFPSATSETAQIGDKSQWVVLYDNFAEQIKNFGLKFGSFATMPKFLDFVSVETVGDTAKVQILKDGQPLFTVFDLQMPAGISYDSIIGSIRNSLGNIALMPAVFGSESFYFLKNGLATDLLRFGDNILAFQFDQQDFESVRGFITSLLTIR